MSDVELLQEHVQQVKRKLDRDKGAYSELLRSIKREHGCTSIAQAKNKLTKLRMLKEEASKHANKLKKEFEKKWNDILLQIE